LVLQFSRTKTFRILAIVGLLIAVYALAGFVIAPKLVRSALLKDIPRALGVTPAVGEIHINPFLFQVTVKDFSLAAAGGEKLLGFEQLFVDFELSSIWHRAFSFVNIDIASPYLGVAVARDGSVNLQQLRPKPSPQPSPREKSQPIPPLRIHSFKVSQGLVSYEDHSRPDTFAARLAPINFELRDFKTGVEGGKFSLTGSSQRGERFEWHGHISVQPIESDGEFQVNGLLARTLWEYLQDTLNFVVNSGTIDLAGTYKFSLQDAATDNLQVAVSKVALSGLTVRPKDSETDWITVPALTVTGTTVDLSKRQAHVDSVSLTGVKLLTWLEADGTVNLMKLVAAPPQPVPAASGAPPAAAAPPASVPTLTASSSAPAVAAPPWAFDLRQFDLRDASISAEDRSTRPVVKVLLAPFSLQVNGASQDLTKPVSLTLETRINEKGSLTVSGQVWPQPVIANLSLKLAGIDLTTVQPYIAQRTGMTLVEGRLGGEAALHYGAEKNRPSVQLAGNITVEKMHTIDDALQDDFINWDRLDIIGLNYSQSPDRLDIEQIVANNLYARVIVEPDESMNVKRVLKIPTSDAATAPAAHTTRMASPDSSAAVPAARPTTARKSAANKPGKTAAQTAAAAPASQTMPMSIKKIDVQNSQANFADLSLTPNFSAGIQKLQGTVVGLSSKPSSRAKVDLKGAIDAFSPVTITGDVNVLGPLYTDLTMNFRNISLPIFNPYSGKFAGYNITKGKLTTELHYKVDGRKLDAQQHLIVEDLEFGDKTASKDAVSLPIKLAVSLLKDRNGVIDLNIPVTGSLDDPEFRLAPVIWKVFVNLLEKAVTAPFALLGELFGGGPDIQFIDFQPGLATLDAAAADKVKTVAKALIERPQLKIEVPIAVVADIDRPALIEAQFKGQLNAVQAAKGGRKKAASPDIASPAFEQQDAGAQADLLTELYSREFGTEPKFPEAVTSAKSKPEAASAKIDFLSRAIRERIIIGDAELQALGQQRALALQNTLLADTQVGAERVFLVANDKATSKDGVVRLELSLQ
jgi:hypothetical protein